MVDTPECRELKSEKPRAGEKVRRRVMEREKEPFLHFILDSLITDFARASQSLCEQNFSGTWDLEEVSLGLCARPPDSGTSCRVRRSPGLGSVPTPSPGRPSPSDPEGASPGAQRPLQ